MIKQKNALPIFLNIRKGDMVALKKHHTQKDQEQTQQVY